MYARNSVRKLPSQLIDGIENMVNYHFVISLTSRYTYLYLSIYDPQGKQCTNQFLLSKNANDENPFSFHRHLNIFIIQLTVICVPLCIFLLIFCKNKKIKIYPMQYVLFIEKILTYCEPEDRVIRSFSL